MMKSNLKPIFEDKPILISPQGGYCRLCMLADQTLVCGYGAGRNLYIRKSRDGGETWSEPISVATAGNEPLGNPLTYANASVFSWAEDKLICGCRAHTAGKAEDINSFYTSIQVFISHDNGDSWRHLTTVIEDIVTKENFSGFWEPEFELLPDGRLAIYYANDCVGGSNPDYPYVPSKKSQHIIAHIWDDEKRQFGKPLIASNGTEHTSRDGMPGLCRLSDGSYAMVIESNADKNYIFTIKILFSKDGLNFSEPRYIDIPSKPGLYSGAPWIDLLPDGRVAVSFQTTDHGGEFLAPSSVRNSITEVKISKRPLTYADRDSITPDDFESVWQFNSNLENHEYSIWPAVYCFGGTLYCCCDTGRNITREKNEATGIWLSKLMLTE